MNQNWTHVAPITFYYDDDYSEHLSPIRRKKISQAVRTFYFGDRQVNHDSSADLTHLYSDRLFIHGVVKTARYHSKFAPVYPYVFKYKPEDGFTYLKIYFEDAVKKPLGVCHGLIITWTTGANFVPPCLHFLLCRKINPQRAKWKVLCVLQARILQIMFTLQK